MKFYLKILFIVLSAIISLVHWNDYGTGDVQIWMRWMTDAQTEGLMNGYIKSVSDYPIGSHFILNIFGYSRLFDVHSLVKLSILFAFCLWIAACVWISPNFQTSRVDSITVALNPSLLLNAIFLSYLDIYFAAPLALSVFFLCRPKPSFFLSGLLLSISIFLKWQPLILLPIFLSWLFGQAIESRRIKEQLFWLCGFLIPLVVVKALFSFYGSTPEAINAFNRAMNHIAPTANAINVNWVLTRFLQSTRPEVYGELLSSGLVDPYKFLWLKPINMYLLCIPYAISCLMNVFRPTRQNFLSTLVIAALGYVLLGYGAHENHSFTAVVLACTYFLLIPRQETSSKSFAFKLLLFSSLHAFINLFIFYVPTGADFRKSVNFDMASALGLFFCLIYIYLIYAQIKRNEFFPFLKSNNCKSKNNNRNEP